MLVILCSQLHSSVGRVAAGKTTLACDLAVAGERAWLTTALVDLDPQGSASAWTSLRVADL